MENNSIAQAPTPAAAQPVQLYSKTAMDMLRLKCPTIRHYLNSGSEIPALRIGLNLTLAKFEGGQETALSACSSSAGFNQAEFENEMQLGRLADTPCYNIFQKLRHLRHLPSNLPGNIGDLPVSLWENCDTSCDTSSTVRHFKKFN